MGPSSPLRRRSNVSTTGRLRQYLPTNTDICDVTQADLDEIVSGLDG